MKIVQKVSKTKQLISSLSLLLLAPINNLVLLSSEVSAQETVRKTIFQTRSRHYLNCYDSRGQCSAVNNFSLDPQRSDELFFLVDLNGGSLNHGDRIMLKMRSGYYVNSYDSRGSLQAIPTYSKDEGSDEVFQIFKVSGSSAGNKIKNRDKVIITTRANYYFNCYDSQGKCQAISTHSDNPAISDEIFTIFLDVTP